MKELNYIFDTQKRINFDKLNLNLKDKQYQTKEMIISAISELVEILNEINWAPYKKKKAVDENKVKEEIIDTFKFLINLCLIWDMTPETFLTEFKRKSAIVEKRFYHAKRLKKLNKK